MLCAPGTVFCGAWLTWKIETVPSPSFETTAVCWSPLTAIASGTSPLATVGASAVGAPAVSITVKSSEPELAANASFSEGSATTPYGLAPTGTFVAVSALRSSTRIEFVPGFAEYPVVPATARYAGNVPAPFTTLPVDTGGFWVRSNRNVLPLRASLTYSVWPSAEAASPLGALNTAPVAGTVNDVAAGTGCAGSNTLTECEPRFATYTKPPTSRTPVGRLPTVTVFATEFVAVSSTLTVPPP